jgi:hypothetical protein
VNGKIAHQRKVENVSVRSAKGVSPDVTEESGTLKLVGIAKAWRQRGAGAVLRNEIPAIHVANDVRSADEIWRSGYSAEGIQRIGDAASGADCEGPTAGKGVNTGSLKATDDIGKRLL